jgi:hypothetical protein
MLDLSKDGFLTTSQIKERARSIFTETAGPSVSSKFTHIPTFKVIEDMAQLGWSVVDAKEVKARAKNSIGFQKHLVVFRNPDVVINGADGDDVFPQVLISNSNDGKNAFTFKCAIFRMVCENGLVVSTQEFSDLKIRHMGYTFEALQEKIREMIEKLPLTIESMNKMKQTQLNEKQVVDFAKKAISTRFTGEEVENVQIDFDKLLEPTRPEDMGNGLWEVFNRIQEKILDGDFTYLSGAKIRKARKIKNFQQDIKINSELWELAESFI